MKYKDYLILSFLFISAALFNSQPACRQAGWISFNSIHHAPCLAAGGLLLIGSNPGFKNIYLAGLLTDGISARFFS